MNLELKSVRARHVRHAVDYQSDHAAPRLNSLRGENTGHLPLDRSGRLRWLIIRGKVSSLAINRKYGIKGTEGSFSSTYLGGTELLFLDELFILPRRMDSQGQLVGKIAIKIFEHPTQGQSYIFDAIGSSISDRHPSRNAHSSQMIRESSPQESSTRQVSRSSRSERPPGFRYWGKKTPAATKAAISILPSDYPRPVGRDTGA